MNTTTKTLSTLTGLALLAGSANAAVTAVLDAGGTSPAPGTSALYDLSTDGDTIGSITGVFTADNADFKTENTSGEFTRWGDDEYDFAANSGKTATWTFGNLAIGSQYSVYASWGNEAQANLSSAAPYTVQGTSVSVNQAVGAASASDLVLNDGVSDIEFQLLGTATVNGSGQIVVTLSSASDQFVVADAIAITPVPEPSSLALLGLGGLCMLRRRRQS